MNKWRALLRVEVKGTDGVGFVIPAIDSKKIFLFKLDELPFSDELHRGQRLHAKINFDATTKEELNISDWEIDPVLSEKLMIEEVIFNAIDYKKQIRCDEYRQLLQDGDIIESGYEEPYYSENNSWDGHHYVRVIRERPETDEEYFHRLKKHDENIVELRKRKYETYLKLKKEFEKGD